MVDELVSRGCPLPHAHSFGTLLHGDTMILYEMSLENEGIYLMKEMSTVPMPCSSGRFSLLLPMINDVVYICNKVKQHAEAIVKLRTDKAEHPFQRPTNWRLNYRLHLQLDSLEGVDEKGLGDLVIASLLLWIEYIKDQQLIVLYHH
ncbi:hypothetical protein A0J61_00833 [Choanephora cucurbitarum]|uniref:Uncharacterized protein n=1 Tax=Choanephora cucurbitarum TaxID=101091 RepID=A0A1C7NQD5_9FUNG|nr:hypothetical protein A0J61_00833 [Choanephora cucurbitarum]